jgi:hypothetical protein
MEEMDTYKTGARLVCSDTDVYACDIEECPKCHKRMITNLGQKFFDPEYVRLMIKPLAIYTKYAADLVLYWDIKVKK